MTKRHLIKVYREAARMVAEREVAKSCIAVHHSTDFDGRLRVDPTVRLYVKIMGSANLDNVYLEDDRHILRVLLLLMMAEWARTDYQP